MAPDEEFRLMETSEAIEAGKRELAECERAVGRDHLDLAVPLGKLAQCFANEGRYAEMVPLCRRRLEITEKSLGPDHLDIAAARVMASALCGHALLNKDHHAYAKPRARHPAHVSRWYTSLRFKCGN